ncbi:MAG TPA: hypothetical protein VMR99_00040 [Candidatus Paceibacterota bacterium]|nr:hypothetical protein [Candidatus Paceibacterota bacterium]
MHIKIKRFDKDLPLPQRQTEGASAFDLTAQGTFVKISHPEWDEVDEMPNKTRGGFGTTGNK